MEGFYEPEYLRLITWVSQTHSQSRLYWIAFCCTFQLSSHKSCPLNRSLLSSLRFITKMLSITVCYGHSHMKESPLRITLSHTNLLVKVLKYAERLRWSIWDCFNCRNSGYHEFKALIGFISLNGTESRVALDIL